MFVNNLTSLLRLVSQNKNKVFQAMIKGEDVQRRVKSEGMIWDRRHGLAGSISSQLNTFIHKQNFKSDDQLSGLVAR